MTFHHSTLGSFGAHLPRDNGGYVTCSDRKVQAIRRAIKAGRAIPAWADVGANRAVAEAEEAVSAWRAE